MTRAFSFANSSSVSLPESCSSASVRSWSAELGVAYCCTSCRFAWSIAWRSSSVAPGRRKMR